MTKNRLLGFLIFCIGIILMYTIDNDLSSFISGILIGVGAVLTLSGKTILSKKKSKPE